MKLSRAMQEALPYIRSYGTVDVEYWQEMPVPFHLRTLDALAVRGLLTRTEIPGGLRYELTAAGWTESRQP